MASHCPPIHLSDCAPNSTNVGVGFPLHRCLREVESVAIENKVFELNDTDNLNAYIHDVVVNRNKRNILFYKVYPYGSHWIIQICYEVKNEELQTSK